MADDYLDVALSWDDELEDNGEGSFEPLEAGVYNFKVTAFERGRYEPKPGAKMAACPQAVYDITIYDNDSDRISKCKEFLPLNTKMAWKIRKFFRSIGYEVEKGEPFKPDYKGAVGKTGTCEISVTENGKYNRIEEFLTQASSPVTTKDDNDW